MPEITRLTDYRPALATVMQGIQASQARAVLAVNAELQGSCPGALAAFWTPGNKPHE